MFSIWCSAALSCLPVVVAHSSRLFGNLLGKQMVAAQVIQRFRQSSVNRYRRSVTNHRPVWISEYEAFRDSQAITTLEIILWFIIVPLTELICFAFQSWKVSKTIWVRKNFFFRKLRLLNFFMMAECELLLFNQGTFWTFSKRFLKWWRSEFSKNSKKFC